MTGNVRRAMSQQNPPSAPKPRGPQGDPWHAFGYVVSGVVIYGLVGWLADGWLGTTFLVAVGILIGAAFGIYMTFVRFRQPDVNDPNSQDK
jgi:ATP synthase protein I